MLIQDHFGKGETMRTIVRVAAFIFIAMVATINLHAQLTGEHPTKEVVQPKRLSKVELFSQDHQLDIISVEQVWYAYAYYNDTHNGPGMASLFTDDGIVHFVGRAQGQNAGQLTDEHGCRLAGHKQIATFYGFNRTSALPSEDHDGLAFPLRAGHLNTNMLIKISDDGKTAMLTTALASNSSVVYRNFFRKTSEGWEISEVYDVAAVYDVGNTSFNQCDINGPIPPVSSAADAVK
jgi:hypothetical protein